MRILISLHDQTSTSGSLARTYHRAQVGRYAAKLAHHEKKVNKHFEQHKADLAAIKTHAPGSAAHHAAKAVARKSKRKSHNSLFRHAVLESRLDYHSNQAARK